jgi:epoxyqueuosine reductase
VTAALKDALAHEAQALGFDAVRVTTPGAIGEAGERLLAFLAAGRHGDMAWLATTAERRRDPHTLWPEARSAIMLAMSYAPASDPLAALNDRSRGVISVYAQGKDYHDILKSKLKTLAASFAQKSGAKVKVFVDTARLAGQAYEPRFVHARLVAVPRRHPHRCGAARGRT